jgi:hypothetical protein
MTTQIPTGLRPSFQEYDPQSLDLTRDADLIIQRTLEFGTLEDVRWLLQIYRKNRIRNFLRQYGERWLNPITFQYWRRLFGVRKWEHSPFPTSRGEVWRF